MEELIKRIDKYNQEIQGWRDYLINNGAGSYDNPYWLDGFLKARENTIAQGEKILEEAAQYGYYMDKDKKIQWSMGMAFMQFIK